MTGKFLDLKVHGLRFTARGWGYAFCAVGLSGIGQILGSPPILFFGLALLLAVLGAFFDQLLALTQLRQAHLLVIHELTPIRPSEGETAIVHSRIQNWDYLGRALRHTLQAVTWRHASLFSQQYPELEHTPHSQSDAGGADLGTADYQNLRRGLWHLSKLYGSRTDYLGCSSIKFQSEIDLPAVIWPASWTLRGQANAWGTTQPRAGNQATHSNPEDTSLREYVVGDDLRRIHWASSARTGELLVRQVDTHQGGQIALILDLGSTSAADGAPAPAKNSAPTTVNEIPHHAHTTFEQEVCISLAASLVLWAARLNLEVSLSICGDQYLSNALTAQDGQTTQLLDQLASAQAYELSPAYLNELSQALNSPASTGLVVILTAAHSPRYLAQALTHRQRNAETPTLTLIVARAENREARLLAGGPVGHHHRAVWIDPHDIDTHLDRLAELIR